AVDERLDGPPAVREPRQGRVERLRGELLRELALGQVLEDRLGRLEPGEVRGEARLHARQDTPRSGRRERRNRPPTGEERTSRGSTLMRETGTQIGALRARRRG